MSGLYIPRSHSEALEDPYWRHAIQEQVFALLSQGMWELDPRPTGVQFVPCGWAFILNILLVENLLLYSKTSHQRIHYRLMA